MAPKFWLLIAVGALIAILAVLARQAKNGRQPADYYSMFLAGIVWLVFGVAMQSLIFLAGAVLFLTIGLAHKKEWKKSRVEGKNAKYAIALGFIVAFILAIIFFYLSGLHSTEAKAKEFCGGANVASVNICNGYIEVVSSLLGGGSTYYKNDGTSIPCPVVGPDSMTPDCKAIFEAKLNSSFACRSAC